jgi:glycerophosphoryl diester phosphodiesterase
MAAYRLAIAQGADFIEPDLVMSKDGVLVCRHENEISGTTDVAARAEFALRRTRKSVDGNDVEGWFAEDFTLAELKTLRCRERLPELRPRNTVFDGQEQILTFAEVLALAMESGVGICPELKHPSFLAGLGFEPAAALAGPLHAAGGQAVADKVLVQCFEVGSLVTLASMSSLRIPTLQLIAAQGGPWDRRGVDYASMITDAGLREIAGYASAIGVDKALIVPRDAENHSLAPTDLITRAHAAGLEVIAWTFRAENYFLPAELRRGDNPAAHGDLASELRAFRALGVDGVFCDFPAAAVAALR